MLHCSRFCDRFHSLGISTSLAAVVLDKPVASKATHSSATQSPSGATGACEDFTSSGLLLRGHRVFYCPCRGCPAPRVQRAVLQPGVIQPSICSMPPAGEGGRHCSGRQAEGQAEHGYTDTRTLHHRAAGHADTAARQAWTAWRYAAAITTPSCISSQQLAGTAAGSNMWLAQPAAAAVTN